MKRHVCGIQNSAMHEIFNFPLLTDLMDLRMAFRRLEKSPDQDAVLHVFDPSSGFWLRRDGRGGRVGALPHMANDGEEENFALQKFFRTNWVMVLGAKKIAKIFRCCFGAKWRVKLTKNTRVKRSNDAMLHDAIRRMLKGAWRLLLGGKTRRVEKGGYRGL